MEKFGYIRIWYVEYYGLDVFVSVMLEILVVYIVSVIEKICVGVGGIMIMYYVLFKVVEMFKILAVLYFDWIDLGMGCLFGGSFLIMLVLNNG